MIPMSEPREASCVPSGDVPRLSPTKTMAKLRVCKLVETPSCRDAEVAPHVLAAAEVEFLDGPAARSEPLVRVLCRYPAGNHVTVGRRSWRGAAGMRATPTIT